MCSICRVPRGCVFPDVFLFPFRSACPLKSSFGVEQLIPWYILNQHLARCS